MTPGSRLEKIIGAAIVCVVVLAIHGCATKNRGLYEPLREATGEDDAVAEGTSTNEESGARESRVQSVPAIPDISRYARGDTEGVAATLAGKPIAANFRNMPLPDFVNEVYGRLLKLDYALDPSLASAADLVTLSLSAPQSPGDLYRTARRVLGDYGVGIVESDGLLRFRRDNDAAQEVPLLVSGGALPDVPASRRPVFSFVSLDVVRNVQVRNWLQQLFGGTSLAVFEDPGRNAIVLRGPVDLVAQATQAAEILDQPLMRGKFSRSFTPTYVDAGALAQELETVLKAEGYEVSTRPPYGSAIILPLASQPRIIVFAASRETLDHIIEWAYELDSNARQKIKEGFFNYKAKNVTASHIAELVGVLKSDGTGQGRQSGTSGGGTGTGSGTDGRKSGVTAYLDGQLVVDNNRNVIFFQGSGQEWRELLQLIREVDKPTPMVVIDVLLAEVTLEGEDESGVEWLFRSGGPLDTNVTGSTRGRLGLGGSGLSLTFDSAGETRAVINAFYSSGRAVIRSSPKLLVKSGESAFIEVGTEIPIITSNSQSVDNPDAPVIQTIQYRKTGVLLDIQPIVQASGMVDLVISQELSEQATTSGTTVGGSPAILNRRVQTSLALRDGGSVLLGGLISSSNSGGQRGIAGLGRIPLLGRLFRSDTKNELSTELLMLVSVYVIDSHEEAVDLTNALRTRLRIPES